MTCWTGQQDGYTTYAIQGNNIVVDANFKLPISEQKGNIYAGKDTRLTLIVDYDNRRVTQILRLSQRVFECD